MPGLSAEEERLWSIVTTNSLDFDAWTALIDETERMSEVCLNSNLACIGVLQWHKIEQLLFDVLLAISMAA